VRLRRPVAHPRTVQQDRRLSLRVGALPQEKITRSKSPRPRTYACSENQARTVARSHYPRAIPDSHSAGGAALPCRNFHARTHRGAYMSMSRWIRSPCRSRRHCREVVRFKFYGEMQQLICVLGPHEVRRCRRRGGPGAIESLRSSHPSHPVAFLCCAN
jgi:hypothetical protein